MACKLAVLLHRNQMKNGLAEINVDHVSLHETLPPFTSYTRLLDKAADHPISNPSWTNVPRLARLRIC